MRSLMERAGMAYAAGCIGALVNSWVVWYMGKKGIPQKFGVAIAPAWSAASFLYPRLVWGGLWGFLFLLPMWQRGFWTGVFSRGILFSIFPTLFQLFYVFPHLADKGVMGLALGKLTPVFVFLYNAVWGLCAAMWLHLAKGRL